MTMPPTSSSRGGAPRPAPTLAPTLAPAPTPAPTRGHPLLGAGDQIRTAGGRTIAFPRLTGRIDRQLRQLDAWLLAEALAETAATGQAFAHQLIGWMAPAGRDGLAPADRALLNEVLFADAAGPTTDRITPAPSMPPGRRVRRGAA